MIIASPMISIFILIASDASVDQVILIIISIRCLRPIMVDGEFTAHCDLGYATVTASPFEAVPYGFKLGMGQFSRLLNSRPINAMQAPSKVQI